MNKMDLVNTMAAERATDVRRNKDGDNFAEYPDFGPGDNIIVAVRVIEGDKERIQNFNGIVLAKRGAGINSTFLIRKISNGIGVERIFPLYSPMIQTIKFVKKGNVRRAKLYYLRGMTVKKIRQKLS